MTRALQHPWVGHDLDELRPLVEITGEPWQDIAGGLNTALAFVGATSLVHDGWADGQADSDEADWTLILRYEIPPAPSPKHAFIRVTIWGLSPGEDGFVTVREVSEGNWVLFEMPVALGPVTALVPSTAFDAASQLEVRVRGDVQLRAIDAEVAAWVPGAWPGGGEHPTGPLSTAVDIVPVELDEADDDYVVSARWVTDCRDATEHCRLRTRMYTSAAAPRIGGGAIVRPLRAAAPVPAEGTDLTIKITAEGGADDGKVWVQVGRGDFSQIYRAQRGAYVESVDVAAAAPEAVYTLTRRLRAERILDVPERYPGFGWLVVWASPGVRLLGVSMWGV